MTALILAIGLGLGVSWVRVLILFGIVTFPIPAAFLATLAIWKSRSRPSVRSSQFCDAVAGELRAGDSLRNALERASISVEANHLRALCASGGSMGEIASEVELEFPDVGPELESLVGRSPDLGQPSAALFDETSNVALAQAAILREVAVATAPARVTALVLFSALVLGTGLAFQGDGVSAYVDSPAQLLAAVVGSTLVVVGFAVSGWMLLRSA